MTQGSQRSAARRGAPTTRPRPAPTGPAIVLVALLTTLLLPCPVRAQDEPPDAEPARPAQLEGRVRDRETERALPAANVILVGTEIHTVAQPDGTFVLTDVPEGRYDVRVTFVGYRSEDRSVEVRSGRTARLLFELEPRVITLDGLEITASRPLIDVKKTSSAHELSAAELEALLTQAPTLDRVVEQQPGVVADRQGLHFRGGRADENLFLVDGVKVRDQLSGESMGKEVVTRAAQEVNVMTGGFGAQYSQAMSGVVDTRLKEGSQRWHGALSYTTDLLFDTRSLHQVEGELSGPNPILSPLLELLGDDRPEITFYVNASFDLSDSYLPSVNDLPGDAGLRSAVRDQVLGADFGYGSFFYPMGQNDWRLVGKTVWNADDNNKLAFTATKSIGFGQDWGDPDIGQIDRNVSNYPWSWAKYLDHEATITRDVNILSLAWNRSLGLRTQTAVRLWRHYSGQRKEVDGQRWDAYDTVVDSERSDDTTFVDTPFFVDSGDAADWSDRYVIVWGLGNDWSYNWRVHRFEMGLSAEYHDVQYMSVNPSTVDLANDLPLGDEFDLFHVTPNVGNLYLQDHFEYEGMSVGLGIAYDYWFPGEQVQHALETQARPHFTPELLAKFESETNSLFGYRYKGHLSPRVGVSFPVSEQAHLFFNYGHYSQRPPYYYVYAKSSSQSGEEYPRIGNPTLNPEIAVSYEIGGEYQFTATSALRATLFQKDMYDYPTSIRLVMRERQTTRSNFFMYWNMDYARSRGIELTLLRNRQNYVSGSLSYTFDVARGKASDPNKSKVIQETGGDSRETTLEEEFLWWNRPHKLTAQLSLLVRENERTPHWFGFVWPEDMNARLYFMIRSGRPYTPENESGLTVGDANSRNGPFDSTCDFSLTKGFRIGRRRFEASFDIYNVFDQQTVLTLDPVTGAAYQAGVGSLTDPQEDPSRYAEYLEETVDSRVDAFIRNYQRVYGKEPDPTLVAAYAGTIAEGVQYDFTSNYYHYQDPSYYGQSRTFRLGIRHAW
jgi:hypothetical protein